MIIDFELINIDLLLLIIHSALAVAQSTQIGMGVGTGGAEGAAAPPTFGTGEQAIALAPPKV